MTRGAGYQWPDCYGYSHSLAGSCSGLRRPDYSSEGSALVPTGATFVDGSGPAPYAGHFVFCTFDAGGRVFNPGGGLSPGPGNCRLDVKQARTTRCTTATRATSTASAEPRGLARAWERFPP